MQEINLQECLQIKQSNARRRSDANVIEYYDIPLSNEIQNYIFKLCQQYDLNSSLVIAIIDTETGGTFDNNLRHVNTDKTIDFGLMQLNSRYHSYFKELVNEPNFDAEDTYHNLHAGIKYLSILRTELRHKCSDDELKTYYLNAYNMGSTGYQRYVRQTGKVSRAYSNKILEKENYYGEKRK